MCVQTFFTSGGQRQRMASASLRDRVSAVLNAIVTTITVVVTLSYLLNGNVTLIVVRTEPTDDLLPHECFTSSIDFIVSNTQLGGFELQVVHFQTITFNRSDMNLLDPNVTYTFGNKMIAYDTFKEPGSPAQVTYNYFLVDTGTSRYYTEDQEIVQFAGNNRAKIFTKSSRTEVIIITPITPFNITTCRRTIASSTLRWGKERNRCSFDARRSSPSVMLTRLNEWRFGR